ncbi:MAG: hypothetical protein JNL83_14420 [Myxococcales bacterium]|nr:hypothetical protein [Myxococcales bacterium]
MSVALPAIISAAIATHPELASEPVLEHAITVAVPSLDGLRGAQIAYERWFPAHRISLSASVQLRQAARGDYIGMRAGGGGELRWFWRATSFLGPHPDGSMIGWFLAARIDVNVDGTHDLISDRWISTTLEVGTSALIGYRLAPWRGLELTPYGGLTWRRDVDLSGRLPSWSRGAIAGGVTIGWLF